MLDKAQQWRKNAKLSLVALFKWPREKERVPFLPLSRALPNDAFPTATAKLYIVVESSFFTALTSPRKITPGLNGIYCSSPGFLAGRKMQGRDKKVDFVLFSPSLSVRWPKCFALSAVVGQEKDPECNILPRFLLFSFIPRWDSKSFISLTVFFLFFRYLLRIEGEEAKNNFYWPHESSVGCNLLISSLSGNKPI